MGKGKLVWGGLGSFKGRFFNFPRFASDGEMCWHKISHADHAFALNSAGTAVFLPFAPLQTATQLAVPGKKGATGHAILDYISHFSLSNPLERKNLPLKDPNPPQTGRGPIGGQN